MFIFIGSICSFFSSLFIKMERTKILMDNFFLFKNPDLGFDYELENLKTYNKFFNKIDEIKTKCKNGEFKENAVFNLNVNNFVKKFFMTQRKKPKNIEDAMKEMQFIFELSKKEENFGSGKIDSNFNPITSNLRRTIESRKPNLDKKSKVSLEKVGLNMETDIKNYNKDNIKNYFLNNDNNNLTNENLIYEDETSRNNQSNEAANPRIYKNSFSNNKNKNINIELRKSFNFNESLKGSDIDFNLNASPIISKLSNKPNSKSKKYENDVIIEEKVNEFEEEENIKYLNRELISFEKEELDKNTNKEENKKINDPKSFINENNIFKSPYKSKTATKTNKTRQTRKKNSENFNQNERSNYIANQNLSDVDISNNTANFHIEYKKYFIKLFGFRSESHKLYMTFWEQFLYNFFNRNMNKRKSINNYKQKLFYLLDKTEEKIEESFDYINILETVQEAKILKEIILEDHQKSLVDLYRRPLIYYERDDKFLDDSSKNNNKNSSFAEEKVNIYSSLDVLFNKFTEEKLQNNYISNIKTNENLINFIRKAT
jgi:hypothetical protein